MIYRPLAYLFLATQQTTCVPQTTTNANIPMIAATPEDLTIYNRGELEEYQVKCDAEVRNSLAIGDTTNAQAWGRMRMAIDRQLTILNTTPTPTPTYHHYHRYHKQPPPEPLRSPQTKPYVPPPIF
jgi:hypothetical protein